MHIFIGVRSTLKGGHVYGHGPPNVVYIQVVR